MIYVDVNALIRVFPTRNMSKTSQDHKLNNQYDTNVLIQTVFVSFRDAIESGNHESHGCQKKS